MDKLYITSCLGSNTFPGGRAVAGYLSHHLQQNVEFVVDIPWQEREQLLDSGQIHIGWICGLLYVKKADLSAPVIELLAAPVMGGLRYQNQPIYFSDIIVRRDSPFHTFAALRGATWAYNEPGSYSGYYLVLHHLNALSETRKFFGGMVETGAHLDSLQMVISGHADVTVIDSTILDNEMGRRPGLANQIRVIDTLGPSPIPPWVVSRQLPLTMRQQLQRLLFDMDNDVHGQVALTGKQLDCFVNTSDADYDHIRAVEKTVENQISM